jgi:hypothetical protein
MNFYDSIITVNVQVLFGSCPESPKHSSGPKICAVFCVFTIIWRHKYNFFQISQLALQFYEFLHRKNTPTKFFAKILNINIYSLPFSRTKKLPTAISTKINLLLCLHRPGSHASSRIAFEFRPARQERFQSPRQSFQIPLRRNCKDLKISFSNQI